MEAQKKVRIKRASDNVSDDSIKAVLYNGSGQVVRTTWYAGSYENVTEGSVTKHYYYINSPDGPVALAIDEGAGTPVMHYLCKDHLGSITGIMEPDGDILEEYSFDAWGTRRNPDNWTYTNISEPYYTYRGFTGHEHLDMFDLIHMNGRIYDPEISRFLSPDPVIQDPYNILNYNRYSYCLNNPLKYVDPSGYTVRRKEEFEFLDLSDVNNIMNRLYNSSGGASARINYTYNSTDGYYYDKEGNFVPWNWIFNSVIAPNSINHVSWLYFAGNRENPYKYLTGFSTEDGKRYRFNEAVTANSDYYGAFLSQLAFVPQGGGDGTPNWINWSNFAATTGAYASSEIGGSFRIAKGGSLSMKYYASAWTGGSRARITTYNLTRLGTNLGVGTSILGAIIGGYNFYTSDRSWGDYGQLGISLLSSGLTLSGPTAPLGIGIGLLDLTGGFNGFYNYLDSQQQLYNNTGGVIVPYPFNGIPTFIPLRRP